ncbi:MAG TPA: MTAP family purine nucleoside phosphorylase [Solirubrobacterales bacterium]
MGRLALALGSSFFGPEGADITKLAGRHGALVLQRHGTDSYTLPHLIDHEANLRWLAEAGCDRILAIGSVGSLDAELGIGSFVCPHDFIALQLGLTTFDDARGHALRGFDRRWRGELLAAWQRSGGVPLADGGVYWQTNGPRFETPAEIRLIAAHADLVGMTLASECVVAGELGLPYAAVCVVDNLANGVGPQPLSEEELEKDRKVNVGRLREALEGALPELVR